MQIARIILIVLGWLFIAVNIAAFIFRSPLKHYNQIKGEFDDPLLSGLGYWVGTIPLFVLGALLLMVALLFKKRLRSKQKPLLDTLLENEKTLESNPD